ncbi:exported hypothetical protein [uncultured Paludibacter sp.]|uniref:DUF4886 domain-containing protein n=1 Tax=uncultured Paludibacter sp. TaxID=497635 RepID=A0A653AFJ6_9BACT|nr:exported hypothetical protein [uncultured Paludibacter sp.]
MKSNNRLLLIFLFSLAFGLTSCTKTNDPIIENETKTDTVRILFIGNSFTYYNNGVDYHLQKMSSADKPADSIIYEIEKVAFSSYTLQTHYKDSTTTNKIKSKKWNIVVLQEQSSRPINNYSLFLEYATKLDNLIKNNGASTVLFMTWSLKDSPSDIDKISQSYYNVGEKLNAKVVPVGLVWDYFVENYPSVNLYFTDDKHPALTGTYLGACSFYYYLFNKNPTYNTYNPSGLSVEEIITIRKAVKDYSTYSN